MGIIKFEVDIPNFEKELSISITIRRDGEVFYSTSSPSAGNITDLSSEGSLISSEIKDVDIPEKTKKKKKTEETLNPESSVTTSRKSKGGKFMNMDF